MIDILALLPFALLGGLLGLDVVSFPQAMISRPIVAGTIAGALAGDPLAGLTIGALLELVALGTLPFGASRYPEWGSASVAGGALHAMLRETGEPADGALVVATLVALIAAWAGGVSMVWLRRLNARWARQLLPKLQAGSASTVVRLQLSGLTADFLRGTVLTLIVMTLAIAPAVLAVESWTSQPRMSGAVVAVLGGSVAAAAVWKVFHAVPRANWLFVSGLALGLVIVWLS